MAEQMDRHLGGCGGQNSAPQVAHSNPWDLQRCYLAWQEGLGGRDGERVPGRPWAPCSHRVLLSRQGSEERYGQKQKLALKMEARP